MAVVGGPAAGSHSRGSAIRWVPASNLPHAMIRPVGRRVICSGTMSHDTGASHRPVLASGGRALIVVVADVAEAVPVVNRRVWGPVPAMPRSPNLARPVDEVVAVSVPCSVPPPLARAAVTTAPGTAVPAASLTTTAGWRVGSQTS